MDDGFRGLKLTDTMTRTKQEFRPLDWQDGAVAEADRRVRLYVCGPTVYDYAHIGNARPVIVFDVLFRLLRHLYGEDRVTYVRNITDVDDKINARAARDHPGLPLNEAIGKVTQATAHQFHQDVAALGCLAPTFEPRATEFVTPRGDGKADMISMIAALIDKDHAYEAGGEVLFDVTSMPDYGKLSNRRLEDQQAGARVAVDSHKRNPGDFVLWKLSDQNEPGWESPFGQEAWDAAGRTGRPKGRPGWHIECSAMSEAYLGPTFDIHGGGLDLIFPHHENEIAQSRCAHGTDMMAQIWMHNGYLQLEGRKMSKSEGNFVTIHDLLHTEKFGGRKWPGEVLRLAMLMTHYREPIDFSVKRLEEAENRLQKWAAYFIGPDRDGSGLDPWHSPSGDGYGGGMAGFQNALEELCDDLATPYALTITHAIDEPDELWPVLNLFGIDLGRYVRQQEILRTEKASSVDVEKLISARLALIREKNWGEADRIRAGLAEQGIQLKDGKDPETGERVTTWGVKR